MLFSSYFIPFVFAQKARASCRSSSAQAEGFTALSGSVRFCLLRFFRVFHRCNQFTLPASFVREKAGLSPASTG